MVSAFTKHVSDVLEFRVPGLTAPPSVKIFPQSGILLHRYLLRRNMQKHHQMMSLCLLSFVRLEKALKSEGCSHKFDIQTRSFFVSNDLVIVTKSLMYRHGRCEWVGVETSQASSSNEYSMAFEAIRQTQDNIFWGLQSPDTFNCFLRKIPNESVSADDELI